MFDSENSASPLPKRRRDLHMQDGILLVAAPADTPQRKFELGKSFVLFVDSATTKFAVTQPNGSK